MLKKSKILILSSGEFGSIYLKDGIFSNTKSVDSHASQLYVISDDKNDKITRNDYFISFNDDESYLTITKNDQVDNFEDWADSDWTKNCKKIIATTDPKLKKIIPNHNYFDSIIDFPSPSDSFISRFIKNRNQNDEPFISDVLVEYITEEMIKVKLDNTITIKKLKDFWDKKELLEFADSFAERFVPNYELANTKMEVSDWVTEYLK